MNEISNDVESLSLFMTQTCIMWPSVFTFGDLNIMICNSSAQISYYWICCRMYRICIVTRPTRNYVTAKHRSIQTLVIYSRAPIIRINNYLNKIYEAVGNSLTNLKKSTRDRINILEIAIFVLIYCIGWFSVFLNYKIHVHLVLWFFCFKSLSISSLYINLWLKRFVFE